MVTVLHLLGTVSTVQALEEDLERRTLGGEFQPGEHLREIELARQYDVGRNTLRAAFDGLARRGLLVKSRNRGVFVRVLTAQDLADVYELRAALEVQAARTLAARGAVPEDARDALARELGLSEDSPHRSRIEADLAFHRAIVAGAGNARMTRAYEDLASEIRLCLGQLVGEWATLRLLAAEHERILAAIGSGRPATAEAAVRHHLEGASARLISRSAAGGGAPAAN